MKVKCIKVDPVYPNEYVIGKIYDSRDYSDSAYITIIKNVEFCSLKSYFIPLKEERMSKLFKILKNEG